MRRPVQYVFFRKREIASTYTYSTPAWRVDSWNTFHIFHTRLNKGMCILVTRQLINETNLHRHNTLQCMRQYLNVHVII